MRSDKPVLIVEDDDGALELFRGSLAEAGFVTKTAQNGAAASYIVDNEALLALVTDVKLPGLNGLQLAKNTRMSRINGKIPIIVISGFLDDEAHRRAVDVGVTETWAKPCDPSHVVESLRARLAAGNEKSSKSKHTSYDVRLINTVLVAVKAVMERHLGPAVTVKKPFLKAEKTEVGFATCLIPLSSHGMVGSMVLSFQRAFLEALFARLRNLGEKQSTDGELAEVASEICTQVAGRMKANFATLGVRLAVGLPEVVVAPNVLTTPKAAGPVLAVPIELAERRCVAEFSFTKTKARQDFASDELTGSILIFED